MNRHAYVLNSPVSGNDPSGLECIWDDGSFDSADDPFSGSEDSCGALGRRWGDPGAFAGYGLGDWSSARNDWLADKTPSSTVYGGLWDLDTFTAYGAMRAAGTLPRSITYGQNDPAALAIVNRPYVKDRLLGLTVFEAAPAHRSMRSSVPRR